LKVLGPNFTSVELCAGAGGQALGLEQAGFEHRALVEIDPQFSNSLRLNRPDWNVYTEDLRLWAETAAAKYRGTDLVAGGLPCPPFSVAGKQLGAGDERNLFPAALSIIRTIRPKAVLIENVRGFLGAVFEDYRKKPRDVPVMCVTGS
jgi:DNA (cytosine-5)-methyltransferase 1